MKEKAVSESTRVCKSGGMVALTYVTGTLIDKLENIFFTSTPHEIEEIATKCGLKRKHNICAGGIIGYNSDSLNKLSDEDFQKYMERYYLICESESLIEAGGLGLWIGIKN